jgi:hypothetical protein
MISMFKKSSYKRSIITVCLILLTGCISLTNSKNGVQDDDYVSLWKRLHLKMKEPTGKHDSYPSSMSICGEMIQGHLNMSAIACLKELS